MKTETSVIKPSGFDIPAAGLFRYAACVVILLAVLLASAATAPEARAVTADEPLPGISGVTPSQLEGELRSRNPNHIHPNIAQLYVEWGYRFGIRADLAFAQMLHETNFLRYGGDVEPWQNNFAGIGATGGGNPGNSFSSPETGVIAHYAHLAWYVYPDHQNQYCNSTYDPRHFGTGHNYTVYKLRDLNGRWAYPGTGYGEAIAFYATEIQNYTPYGNWMGSFNEVTGMPDTKLSTEYYFPWYDSLPQNGMVNNWIMVGNRGSGTATIEIYIAGEKMNDPSNPGNDFFSIPEGGEITPSFSNLTGGPVKVVSTSGQKLIASQRVLYHESFNEVMGVPVEDLRDSYEFTWYDCLPQNSMVGNWILVSNQGDQPADVEIWIGDSLKSVYSTANGNALAPGAIVTPIYPSQIGGPVSVRSTNHQPLIVSQRAVYKESFNEVMGFPTDSIASEYLFTWYDSAPENGMNGDWVMVANHGGQAADVDIYIGQDLKASYRQAGGNALEPGQMVTPYFPNLTNGPVRVVSTNSQPLMVSQRILFRDSFEEVQGARPLSLSDNQWFTWYDSKLVNFMRGNWILVANMGSGQATVEIYLGGEKMQDPSNPGNDFFTIPEGGRIYPQFTNTIGGPVQVVCTSGQPLMVSQRVLYKDGLIR